MASQSDRAIYLPTLALSCVLTSDRFAAILVFNHIIPSGGSAIHGSSPQQYTVLLIDDNPELLKLFTLGLPDFGDFQVVTAEDGIEGLTKSIELQPDCIVIDVMMPSLNGYQLVRTLRGDPQTAAIPLIMLTAMVQDRDQFVGLASGADHYLCKPVMTSELSRAIMAAIQISKPERQAAMAHLAERLPGELGK